VGCVGQLLVLLDHTSATHGLVRAAVSECLRHSALLLLVTSGIKNDQGGDDRHGYGEMRMLARPRDSPNSEPPAQLLERLSGALKLKLFARTTRCDPGVVRLDPMAHALVRAYREAGFAFSLGRCFPCDAPGAPQPADAANAASAASAAGTASASPQAQQPTTHVLVEVAHPMDTSC